MAIQFDDVAGRIRCYAVSCGACWLGVGGVKEPVRLSTGDYFVLASSRPFTLASDLRRSPLGPHDVFGEQARRSGVATYQGGGGVFLTGSRFTIEGRYAALLIGALRPMINLDAHSVSNYVQS